MGSKSVRQASWLISGAVVSAGVAFASNLVLVRYLSPSEFGRFALAMATIGLVHSILSMRLSVLIIRTPDDEWTPDVQRAFHTAVVWETAVGALAVAVWFSVADLWSPLSASLVGITACTRYLASSRAMFERGQHYASLAKQETAGASLAHVLAALLVIGGVGESALYIREAFRVALGMALLKTAGGLSWHGLQRIEAARWRWLFEQARLLWADFFLESAFHRLQILAAAAITGESGAGVFAQAKRLAQVPHEVLQPLTGRLALNWFSREPDLHARRARRLQIQSVVGLPLLLAVVSVWLFADDVIPWVFGEPWRPVAPVLIGLSGSILFPSLFSSNKMLLTANNTMRPLLIGRLLQVAPVTLAYLLLPLIVLTPVELAGLVSLGWACAYASTSYALRAVSSPARPK